MSKTKNQHKTIKKIPKDNKSIKTTQTSLANAAHYPHFTPIPDLEGRHGDLQIPPPLSFNQMFLVSLQSYRGNFIKLHSNFTHKSLSNGRISDYAVARRSGLLQKSNLLFLLASQTPRNPITICWVLAGFLIGQSVWWSRSPPKFNHLFLLPPRTPS